MKFIGAIVAYLFMAILLGWGILQAVGGHFSLLIVGALAYILALAKLGCLPPSESH